MGGHVGVLERGDSERAGEPLPTTSPWASLPLGSSPVFLITPLDISRQQQVNCSPEVCEPPSEVKDGVVGLPHLEPVSQKQGDHLHSALVAEAGVGVQAQRPPSLLRGPGLSLQQDGVRIWRHSLARWGRNPHTSGVSWGCDSSGRAKEKQERE